MASLGFGVGPFGTEPFGSPSEYVLVNSMLVRPSSRVLIELHLSDSFPLYLTADPGTTHQLDASPLRVSTEDLYPGGALGSVLFERRLLENQVELKTSLVDEMNNMQRIESIQFEIDNSDGSLNLFFTREMRGKKVSVHLYDKNTGELTQNVFAGEITAFTFSLHKVSILATSLDVALLRETVPKAKVTLDVFPTAQEVGTYIPYGMGIGLHIPSRYVKAWVGTGDPDHYDYAFMSGNCGFVRIWRGDRVITDATSYERLHKTYMKNGRFLTAIRFRNSQDDPITADVQRIYPDVDDQVLAEWKWDLGIDSDVTTGLTAVYYGNMSDSDRCAGPTGYGVGAINFNGVDAADIVTVPGIDFALQNATFEFDVYIDADDHNPSSIVIVGPLSNVAYTVDGYGWWVLFDDNVAGPRLSLYVRTSDGVVRGNYCSISFSTWHRITVRLTEGTYRITKDEDITNQGTVSVPGECITYLTKGEASQTQKRIRLGGRGVSQQFQGKIGWLRVSGMYRPDDYIKASTRLMHRNVMQLIRETVEQIGTVTINDGTGDYCWDNAVSDIEDVETGSLHCDGYVTEETEVQEVLKALCLFRDIRLWRNSSGQLEAAVSKTVAATSATFGVGDQYNNIIGDISRTRLSTAEATSILPIEYRPRRGSEGSLDGYYLTTEGTVLPVGAIADPLQLAFVWDRTTADIIRSFRCKRMKTRDEQLSITVGHEGRLLAPGNKVAINIPAHGISGGEYQVAAMANRITEFGLDLVPYAADDYVYVSQALPVEEQVDTSRALNVGNFFSITALAAGLYSGVGYSDETVELTVKLRQFDQILPNGNGEFQQFETLYGAATHWQAISKATEDNTSYIAHILPPGGKVRDSFVLADFVADDFCPDIYSIGALVRGVRVGGTYGKSWVNLRLRVGVSESLVLYKYTLEDSWAADSAELTTNPFTAEDWTLEDLANIELIVEAETDPTETSNVTVKISQLYLYMYREDGNPGDWSVTKIWKTIALYPTPVPNAPSLMTAWYRIGKSFWFDSDQLDVTDPNSRHYYWVRVYDLSGRASDVAYTSINIKSGSRP